jgi:multiple sugar transport system permease protein
MSRPILGVVSVFAVIATWKDLVVFIAALTISSVIPIALFLLFQRLFLRGEGHSGALKG